MTSINTRVSEKLTISRNTHSCAGDGRRRGVTPMIDVTGLSQNCFRRRRRRRPACEFLLTPSRRRRRTSVLNGSAAIAKRKQILKKKNKVLFFFFYGPRPLLKRRATVF